MAIGQYHMLTYSLPRANLHSAGFEATDNVSSWLKIAVQYLQRHVPMSPSDSISLSLKRCMRSAAHTTASTLEIAVKRRLTT